MWKSHVAHVMLKSFPTFFEVFNCHRRNELLCKRKTWKLLPHSHQENIFSWNVFNWMNIINRELKNWIFHRFQEVTNLFSKCVIWSRKKWAKQLLWSKIIKTVFIKAALKHVKLWCEWGIRCKNRQSDYSFCSLTFAILTMKSFLHSITVGIVEKFFVRGASINSVPFLDIIQIIVFLFARNVTKSSRNSNRYSVREWQILGHDEKAVPGFQSVKTGTRKTTGSGRAIVAVVKETAASMQ